MIVNLKQKLINKMRNTINKSEKGATLVDSVIAMVVSLIGIVAVYSLVIVSLQTQAISKDLASANSFARAKVEELKNRTRTAGGDLTTNAVGYFDTPSPDYTRRWQIADDTIGSQTVSVRVIPTVQTPLVIEVNLMTRMR
jgi:Tfp pilus assembly protein PilW